MRTKRRLVAMVAVFLAIFLIFQSNVFAQDTADKTSPTPQTAVKQDTELQLNQILRILNFFSRSGHDPEFVSKLNDFLAVLYEIQLHFVDDKTSGELLDLAMKGVVSGLDPYSHLFIGKNEVQDMLKRFSESSYPSGVGLSIGRFQKYIYVTEVFEGYSAARAGIEPGDIVTKVNGQSVYGMTVNQVSKLIKEDGKEKTSVSLEIKSKHFQEPKTFTLVRENVKVASVVYKDLGDDIGYIKVRAFNQDESETTREFSNALSLSNKKVIIDLRNNGGGSLATVIDMLSNFLGPGKTVIIQKDRDSSLSFATQRPSLSRLPQKVVVLVNNFSASASEIMAGNMQYYGIAKIIGVRTFGKATVQNYFDLDKDEDGHSPDKNTDLLMGITVARYLLPDGRDITSTGIVPDIEIEQPEDFRSYEYGTERDLQFQAAIKFLNEN